MKNVGDPATADHKQRVSPLSLILFKGEARARLLAFFSASALIIHPCF